MPIEILGILCWNYVAWSPGEYICLDNKTNAPIISSKKQEKHPFPMWLIGGTQYQQEERKKHETSFQRTNSSSTWIYDKRFFLVFSEYPNTILEGQKFSITYLDCQTGWIYLQMSYFNGRKVEDAVPPEESSNLADNRNSCEDIGLSVGF